MKYRWNWLRDRLEELGTNPSRFAKDLDWPASRVYELFSGKTKAIPLDRVAKAAAILGVRLDDMINFNSGLTDNICFSQKPDNISYEANTSSVPELDLYNLRDTVFSVESEVESDFLNETGYTYTASLTSPKRIKDNWKIPEEYLEEINIKHNNVYIIEAISDSMYPTISSGDKAIVDTSPKGRFPSPDGIFAIWDGLGITIKRLELIPNSEPPALKIISDNPKHNTYERLVDQCKIIGRVASIIKKV